MLRYTGAARVVGYVEKHERDDRLEQANVKDDRARNPKRSIGFRTYIALLFGE